MRDIARALKKNPSSISREIKGNSVNGQYCPFKANHKSYVKRVHSKYQGMKIVRNTPLLQYITQKLKQSWTPEQIAGRLKLENNDVPVISAKSIYKYLRTPNAQHLCQYLPSKRRKQRKRSQKRHKRQVISNRISIDQRPAIVDSRLRFGDFEGDTLGRPGHELPTLVGLVERQSLFFMAQKVSRPKHSMDGFKQQLRSYHHIVQSLTLDNGLENIRYEQLNVPTYFCHPFSAWQKPSIENTFARLRRFIPKKSSLTNYTEQQIADIIHTMNNTPRKCLNFATPQEVFDLQFKHQVLRLGV